MKAIINFYSKRKDPFTIISAASALLAMVLRIVLFSLKGAEHTTAEVIWLLWLPLIAAFFFAVTLLFCGQEALYKTVIPVLMTELFFIIWGVCELSILLYIPLILTALGGSAMYILVTSGKIKTSLPAVIAFAVPAAGMLSLFLRLLLLYELFSLDALSAFVLSAALFFAVLSMRPRYDDGSYVRRWGDRNDGRRLRSLSAIFTVSPYIMVERNDASNFIKDSIEITEIEKYIREKRKQGLTNFGIMHVIIAAYVRAVASYPGINRFIGGQKIYSRDYVEVNMSIKKEMITSAPDTVIKVRFSPSDTAEDIYRKMNDKIEEVKNTPLDSSFDGLARAINYIPGILLKFVVFMLKMLDYFGLLPRALTRLSPFHGSMFITSMGSLGIPPIYHHLYNFGNVPVFCSFGCKRSARELNADGEVVFKKYVDWTWVTDERICDGFYFATALKTIKRTLIHPEKLDFPPEKVERDCD